MNLEEYIKEIEGRLDGPLSVKDRIVLGVKIKEESLPELKWKRKEDRIEDNLVVKLMKLRGASIHDLTSGKKKRWERAVARLLDFPGGREQLKAIWKLHDLVKSGSERAKLAFDACLEEKVSPKRALEWAQSNEPEEALVEQKVSKGSALSGQMKARAAVKQVFRLPEGKINQVREDMLKACRQIVEEGNNLVKLWIASREPVLCHLQEFEDGSKLGVVLSRTDVAEWAASQRLDVSCLTVRYSGSPYNILKELIDLYEQHKSEIPENIDKDVIARALNYNQLAKNYATECLPIQDFGDLGIELPQGMVPVVHVLKEDLAALNPGRFCIAKFDAKSVSELSGDVAEGCVQPAAEEEREIASEEVPGESNGQSGDNDERSIFEVEEEESEEASLGESNMFNDWPFAIAWLFVQDGFKYEIHQVLPELVANPEKYPKSFVTIFPKSLTTKGKIYPAIALLVDDDKLNLNDYGYNLKILRDILKSYIEGYEPDPNSFKVADVMKIAVNNLEPTFEDERLCVSSEIAFDLVKERGWRTVFLRQDFIDTFNEGKGVVLGVTYHVSHDREFWGRERNIVARERLVERIGEQDNQPLNSFNDFMEAVDSEPVQGLPQNTVSGKPRRVLGFKRMGPRSELWRTQYAKGLTPEQIKLMRNGLRMIDRDTHKFLDEILRISMNCPWGFPWFRRYGNGSEKEIISQKYRLDMLSPEAREAYRMRRNGTPLPKHISDEIFGKAYYDPKDTADPKYDWPVWSVNGYNPKSPTWYAPDPDDVPPPGKNVWYNWDWGLWELEQCIPNIYNKKGEFRLVRINNDFDADLDHEGWKRLKLITSLNKKWGLDTVMGWDGWTPSPQFVEYFNSHFPEARIVYPDIEWLWLKIETGRADYREAMRLLIPLETLRGVPYVWHINPTVCSYRVEFVNDYPEGWCVSVKLIAAVLPYANADGRPAEVRLYYNWYPELEWVEFKRDFIKTSNYLTRMLMGKYNFKVPVQRYTDWLKERYPDYYKKIAPHIEAA